MLLYVCIYVYIYIYTHTYIYIYIYSPAWHSIRLGGLHSATAWESRHDSRPSRADSQGLMRLAVTVAERFTPAKPRRIVPVDCQNRSAPSKRYDSNDFCLQDRLVFQIKLKFIRAILPPCGRAVGLS